MQSAMTDTVDFLIIGGGIAAASAGYWLAPHGRVLLLERESQPGYHSTGRSAALFMESYGTAQVRALTMASRAFLQSPPEGLAEHPVLSPRGAMMVAAPGQDADLAEHWEILRAMSPKAKLLDSAGACAMVPALRADCVLGAVYEPDAADMDVHAIHQGYLRGLRHAGGRIECSAEAETIERVGEMWRVTAGGKTYEAPVLLNAAGAWADVVAARAGVPPIGLEPRRRSAFIFAPPEGFTDVAKWPMTAAVDETWYFKPDAAMMLGSPANADPVEPQDIQPEEMDIALAIHRIEENTTMTVRRPTRTWAGLRSFVADGDLVGGFDPDVPGFFWVAAQGGYGIQTSAAMGETCAALARGLPVPERVAGFGLTAEMLSPSRLASVQARATQAASTTAAASA